MISLYNSVDTTVCASYQTHRPHQALLFQRHPQGLVRLGFTTPNTEAIRAKIASKTEFAAVAEQLKAHVAYREPRGWGIFRAQMSQADKGKMLTGSFPFLNWNGMNLRSFVMFAEAAGMFKEENLGLWQQPEVVVEVTPEMRDQLWRNFTPYWDEAEGANHLNAQVAKYLFGTRSEDLVNFRFVAMFDDVPPQSLPMAYMKLMALSKCFVRPLELNLQGIFGLLPNVAWALNRALDLDWLHANALILKLNGNYPAIDYVDKFPRYLMQVPPDDDIRILSTHSVRFGAHLSGGTTVMPGAAYINFNAGTLGRAMVEGRISSSATIGGGTDVGGGASILGTLSGGNTTPIRIGKDCLLGANSVTGIRLGDGCIVDAGVAILAGTKVYISPEAQQHLTEVNPAFERQEEGDYKGRELSGLNGVHFRVDSQSGILIAQRSTRHVALNEALHG